MAATAPCSRIDWSDLQLNLPNPCVPGAVLHRQRRRRHAAPASSSSLHARPATECRTSSAAVGSRRRGSRAAARRAASTFRTTQCRTRPTTRRRSARKSRRPPARAARLRPRRSRRCPARSSTTIPTPREQDAYSLVNFRGGVRVKHIVRRGMDAQRVRHLLHPVAFAYRPFAPSGFVGESGRPRTFGVRLGVGF